MGCYFSKFKINMQISKITLILFLLVILINNQRITINNYGCRAYKTDGTCQECSNSYYMDREGICQQVNPNCKTFNQNNGDCLSCYDGYQLVQTTCLPANLLGSLQQNCFKYSGGKCIQCSQGYYFNSNGRCTQIDPNCRTSSNGLCTTCYDGYYVNNGKCLILQVTLDPFCRKFQKNVCLECSQGYYFSQSKICTKIDDNCKKFNLQILKCDQCYQGYQIGQFNLCIRRTSNSESALCRVWANNQCSECSQGSYFNQNRVCVAIDPLCKDFDRVNRICIGCYIGFRLVNGKCIIGSDDPFCKNFKNGVCLECSFRYFINSNKKCELISPLCKQFSQSNGSCTSCFVGYSLNNGNCQQDTYVNRDALCAQWNGQVCVKCSNGAYFSQTGICLSADPLCKTFNESNGNCTSCFAGYKIQLGKCIIDTSLTVQDSNCNQFQNNQCIQCSKGYYFNTLKKCVAADPLCRSFRQDNGDCLTCYVGYYLFNGDCLVSTSNTISDKYCLIFQFGVCTKCMNGYFVGQSGGCQKVSILCKTYNLSTGACNSCYQGFSLSNGKCSFENDITVVVQNCITWSNQVCIACDPNFALRDGKCVLF